MRQMKWHHVHHDWSSFGRQTVTMTHFWLHIRWFNKLLATGFAVLSLLWWLPTLHLISITQSSTSCLGCSRQLLHDLRSQFFQRDNRIQRSGHTKVKIHVFAGGLPWINRQSFFSFLTPPAVIIVSTRVVIPRPLTLVRIPTVRNWKVIVTCDRGIQ